MENCFFIGRRFFAIFLLISLTGFLIWPQVALADVQISKYDRHLLLDSIQKQPLFEKYIDFPKPEQQIAILLIRNAIKAKELNYLFVELPKETLKTLIKEAAFLLFLPGGEEIAAVLEKIEKESIEKAVEIAKEWFLKNEIKVASGILDGYLYNSYKGNLQSPFFGYNVTYRPFNNKSAEVVAEFYSPEIIEPPDSKGSNVIFGNYWEIDTWLATGNEKLDPFIIRIKGKVREGMGGGYIWSDDSVEVIFSEPVPEISVKEMPSFWDKTKSKFKEIVIDIIVQQIKDSLSELNPFLPAALVQTPVAEENQSLGDEASEILTIKETKEGIISEIERILEEEDIFEPETQTSELGEGDKSKLTLVEIQEMLDDIAEKIDMINQDVLELVKTKLQEDAFVILENEAENGLSEIEEIVEEIEKEELEEPKLLDEEEEKEIILCEKTGEPTRNKVIINEIAWMGGINSANDEWIELKNISGTPVNLSGWQLWDKEKQIKIILSNGAQLPNNEFLLLERTDDDSVPQLSADFIYAGGLNNSNETLYLFDENCQLMDEVLAFSGWPAGDNNSKRTMERRNDLLWQTSLNSGGTPKNENSSGYYEYSGGGGSWSSSLPPEEESIPSVVCSQENLPQPIYQPIIFNEIGWMGSASSSADEWIELKNISTSSISLANWQLIGIKTQNSENNIELLLKDQDLLAGAFYLLERTNDDSVPGISASQLFNGSVNDSEFVLRLFNNQCQLIDEVKATSTWPAGRKSPERRTMERGENLSWQTSFATSSINGLFGTPKSENSRPEEISPEENQPPTALFNYKPENPIINQEIIFDAGSSTDSDGEISSFLWNFDDTDSTTTNQSTTTHFYSVPGNYSVELRVVDNKGATSSLTAVTISISQEETLDLGVIVNEIAWMGTTANSADEWVELYNNNSDEIDLTNWTFEWSHGTTTHSIIFSTSTGSVIIRAQGFYLLERSDDDTVSGVPADQIFTGGLNNNGEKLELRNANGDLIDAVDCSAGWFAGTTTPVHISMERISSQLPGSNQDNWANNNLISKNGEDVGGNKIYGTPKSENSVSKSQTEISNSDLDFNQFENIALTFLGNPYLVADNLSVPQNKTLIIEPGVTLKFYQNAGLTIGGTLLAQGTETEKIIFSNLIEKNYWQGISFGSFSFGSALEWVEIKYARKGVGEAPAILVENASILFKNSILENYADRGIKLINSTSTIERVSFLGAGIATSTVALDIKKGNPTVKNCYFRANRHGIFVDQGAFPIVEGNNFEQNEKPVFVTYNSTFFPVFRNNKGSGNQIEAILIRGIIAENSVWGANSLAYLIEDFIDVATNTNLTVSPGAIVKFKTGAYLNIYGTLLAQGTETEKIIFTSISPPQATWKRIYFSPESRNSILEHALISYGGGYSGNASVYVKQTAVDFNNSEFSNSAAIGLYLQGSTSTVRNSHFDNNKFGIQMSDSGICPELLEGLTFENNSTYDIWSQDCACIPVAYLETTNNNCK